MNCSIENFENNITAAQATFQKVAEKASNADLFKLKDATFDAISQFAQTTDDKDLSQLLARAAIEVHLFPTRGPDWHASLIEKINGAIAAAFQVAAFMMIDEPTDASLMEMAA